MFVLAIRVKFHCSVLVCADVLIYLSILCFYKIHHKPLDVSSIFHLSILNGNYKDNIKVAFFYWFKIKNMNANA